MIKLLSHPRTGPGVTGYSIRRHLNPRVEPQTRRLTNFTKAEILELHWKSCETQT